MFERTRRDEFWWSSITGPRIFVFGAVSALLDGKMVVLQVPPDLPWRESMRSTICNAFQERFDSDSGSDMVIEMVDALDESVRVENKDPGRFLLSRFANGTVRNGYRQSSKQTIQEYIRQSGILRNKLVWVKGLDDDSTEQWISFCRDFALGTKDVIEDGLFVIETRGSDKITERKNMKVLAFDDHVNRYDVQVFNSFIVDELDNDYSDEWKRYISTTAASLCDFDAEISECLLRITDFRKESPVDGMQRIANSPEFSRRGVNLDIESDSSSSSSSREYRHILSYCRAGDMTELNRRVWAAQVQVLYPLIELERVRLISDFWDLIENAISKSPVYQFGMRMHDPMDVELGTLCYMMSTHRDFDDFYILYIQDQEVRGRIFFLRECRNKLSHMDCCTPYQVMRLLNRV